MYAYYVYAAAMNAYKYVDHDRSWDDAMLCVLGYKLPYFRVIDIGCGACHMFKTMLETRKHRPISYTSIDNHLRSSAKMFDPSWLNLEIQHHYDDILNASNETVETIRKSSYNVAIIDIGDTTWDDEIYRFLMSLGVLEPEHIVICKSGSSLRVDRCEDTFEVPEVSGLVVSAVGAGGSGGRGYMRQLYTAYTMNEITCVLTHGIAQEHVATYDGVMRLIMQRFRQAMTLQQVMDVADEVVRNLVCIPCVDIDVFGYFDYSPDMVLYDVRGLADLFPTSM